jgi:hypothetical protein
MTRPLDVFIAFRGKFNVAYRILHYSIKGCRENSQGLGQTIGGLLSSYL